MADTENSAETVHPKAPGRIGLVRDSLSGMWALWNDIDDYAPPDAEYVLAELAAAWKHDRDDARANLDEALETNAVMLAALRDIKHGLLYASNMGNDAKDMLGKANAAIAKAEGRGEGDE